MLVILVSALLGMEEAKPSTAAGLAPEDLKPDPKDVWHIVSWDPAITTSKCIGDPVTPRCALETFKACSARLNMAFCETVIGREISLPERRVAVWYRITSMKVLSAKTARRDINPPEKPGDVHLLAQQRFCVEGKSPCPFPEVENSFYHLRQAQDRRWSILGWYIGSGE
ncbi:MAG: hypothetical protein H7841_18340 [Magnetospirillum sp. WYHS-4]